jgi:hypothetical protein
VPFGATAQTVFRIGPSEFESPTEGWRITFCMGKIDDALTAAIAQRDHAAAPPAALKCKAAGCFRSQFTDDPMLPAAVSVFLRSTMPRSRAATRLKTANLESIVKANRVISKRTQRH